MAHIKKLTDKPRGLPWRAQIRRSGHKVMVKMFMTKAEAESWASEHERTIRLTGLPMTNDDLKKHTVGDIVRRYVKEITPTKGCRISETACLNKFLRNDICKKSLAFVTRQDVYAYMAERSKETTKAGTPIKPSTLRREFNSIQHVFELAREQWGLTNLQNPFRSISIKGSMHRRKRRLLDGELSRLEVAARDCRGLNEYYVPLAIYLAVETAMRLQEIFNLRWTDINTQKRQIEIRKSKTDYLSQYEGRTIILPAFAELLLNRLQTTLLKGKRFNESNLIFPMTASAFKQSWMDVRKRAKITGLTFHDLRREAGSRFEEAGLTTAEHNLMMGHTKRDMSSLYIAIPLKSIRDKLDRYKFGGLTLDEAFEKYKSEGLNPEENNSIKHFVSKLDPYRLPDIIPMLRPKPLNH